MEVPVTPDQERRLQQLAVSMGRDPEDLAQEALREYLHQESDVVEAVLAGLASLDRGEYLTHDAVGAQMDGILNQG